MLENTTIRQKVLVMTAAMVVGLLVQSYIAQRGMRLVAINGPLYASVRDSQNLVADVLPPSAYIQEAFLVAHQLLDPPDDSTRARLLSRMGEVRAAFEARHAYWRARLTDPEQRKSFSGDSYRSAQGFFETYERVYLPQLNAGNTRDARATLNTAMTVHYTEHTKSIMAVVGRTRALVATSEAAAEGSTRTLLLETLLAAVVLAALSMLGGHWLARSISRRLDHLRAVFDAMASRDLTRRVDVETQDEVSAMLGTANKALDSVRGALSSIAQHSDVLAAAAEGLRTVSETMAASAEQTAAQAQIVTVDAGHVSDNVRTIAASTDRLTISVNEIARSSAHVAGASHEAVSLAEAADRAIRRLGDSSSDIDESVRMIRTIAEQTNLLALNATVEAARAGEAGKGFALVASEVKLLASETARATQHIAERTEAIRLDLQGAVAANAEIRVFIGKMNDEQSSVTGAIERHSDTACQINRSLGEGVRRTADISKNITGLAEAARHTSSGAGDTRMASGELARLAAELRSIVSQFVY